MKKSDKLQLQRAVLKENVQEIIQISPTDLNEAALNSTLQLLDKRMAAIEAKDSEIQAGLNSEEDLRNDMKASMDLDAQVSQYRSQLLLKIEISQSETASASQSGVGTGGGESKPPKTKHSKLPQLTLPKYSGDPLQWIAFWDQFEAAVDQNTDLSDVIKFNYLKSSLQGGAEKLIEGLAVTNRNYPKATAALHERYGQKHIIVNARIEALIDLPKVHDTTKLRSIYDKIQCHIRGLESLDIEPASYSLVIAPLILKKIPAETRLSLSSTHGEKIWDLDELRTTLKDEVMALERCEVADTKSGKPPKAQNGGKHADTTEAPTTHAFHLQTKGLRRCSFCDGEHTPFKCSLSIDARRDAAKQKGLCFNCLKENHRVKDCKNQGACKNCSKTHHTALCYRSNPPGTSPPGRPPHSTPPQSGRSTSQTGYPQQYPNQSGRSTSQTDHPMPLLGTSSQSQGVLFGGTGASNHVSSSSSTETNNWQNSQSAHGSPPNTQSFLTFYGKGVLLKTAGASVSSTQSTSRCNIVFDDCSQYTYVSQGFVDAVAAKPTENIQISVNHFLAQSPVRGSHQVVKLRVHNRAGQTHLIEAIVVDDIALPIHRAAADRSKFAHFPVTELADPDCLNPSMFPIDILVGAHHYYEFVTGRIHRFTNLLIAAETTLGWVLSGLIDTQCPPTATHSFFTDASSLGEKLQRFLDIDAIERNDSANGNVIDQQNQFMRDLKKQEGRYSARFLWDSSKMHEVPDNRNLALHRYRSTQKRQQKNPKLHKAYTDTMSTYVDKGFIKKVEDESKHSGILHYVPHHPVVQAYSHTTTVRIVFDGSARQSMASTSLNDAQLEGPNLTGSAFGILLRFRQGQICVVSDIEKAYLQIILDPLDRDATRFFFSFDPYQGNPAEVYRFKRVGFGFKSSAFLLNATLNHHVTLHQSKLSVDIRNSLYVDNVIVGLDTVNQAMSYYRGAKMILQEAGMNLREWASNSREFVNGVPEIDRGVYESIKVLGYKWYLDQDRLCIKTDAEATSKGLTKRIVVSIAATLFDPLGILMPITATGKMFIQELWTADYSWDDPLSDDHKKRWEKILAARILNKDVSVPRWFGSGKESSLELHTFVDASPKCYSAVVYIRVLNPRKASTHFVCSRSKLSPVKRPVTLPKLELCAILFGTKLTKLCVSAFSVPIHSVIIWSDSQVAISWSMHQEIGKKRLKDDYVRRTLSQIQEVGYPLRYVPTADNPADLCTRPFFQDLQNKKLWWHGPEWLTSQTHPESQPSQDICPPLDLDPSDLEDTSSTPVQPLSLLTLNTTPITPFGIQLDAYSNLQKLYAVTARCIVFINRLCHKNADPLVLFTYRQQAKLLWNRYTQQSAFSTDLKVEPSWKQLGVYKDKDGILRCKGRMQFSGLSFSAKTPKLLPAKHHYSTLVIQNAHTRLFHQGLIHTVCAIRQEHWVLRCKQQVKSFIRKCLVCRKWDGKPFTSPAPAPLPEFRVNIHPPFTYTGLDYAGPVQCKEGKTWICLFTCASTRAIHLDVVDSLTTDDFLQCLRRFVSRRGSPLRIISDNAKAFKLASHVLELAWENIITDDKVYDYTSKQEICWQYNVERAPWWGGFFERMVGLVKRCLRKGTVHGVFKRAQLYTQLTEIEAIINSRPLTFVHDDPAEPPITPKDLMGMHRPIGMPIQEESGKDAPFDPAGSPSKAALKRLAQTQQYFNHFWQRFQKEYLTQLREHHNVSCQMHQREIKHGELVLIKDDLPRRKWRMGIIQTIFLGKDAIARAAVVKTSTGYLQRPVQLLVPLEISSGQPTPLLDTNNQDKADNQADQNHRPGRKAKDKAQQVIRGLYKDSGAEDV